MIESSRPSIQIDLNEFKFHFYLRNKTQLTLHFNSPSRRFYLSVIALVVNEMKRLGKIKSIPLQEHLDLLVLLNESIGGAAGSSEKESLLHRIYSKWKDALPNLEEAPLFKVLGKKKEVEEGATGKIYSFTDVDKDEWANLFEYMGSEENVRLKFAIDKIGVGLDETSIIFEDSRSADAWDQFIFSLKKDNKEEPRPVEEIMVPEPPGVPFSAPQEQKVSWLSKYRWVMPVVVIVVIAASVIWKLYTPSTPQPEVIPKEKIVVPQPERTSTAMAPSVEVVSKEKVTPPSSVRVSKKVTPAPPKEDIASKEKMAFPLPDKPSIAVLPFVNLSGDPKQEFLSDGMTEEIITTLTKVPQLFVIARNSTFTYKGKPVKIKQVSEELGVRYVLEGGIQRSGNHVRITVQLIDALTGNHLWAERYDRDLKDIFALQDEITIKILTGVEVKLALGGDVLDCEKYAEKYYNGRQGLDCYLKLMEARRYMNHWTIQDNNIARRMAEEAIAMCPENPMGYALLGWIYHIDVAIGNTQSRRETIEKGIKMAEKALAMDDSVANTHALLAFLYLNEYEHDKAIVEGERAMALSPAETVVLTAYAINLTYAGRPEEAIPLYEKAIRLTPLAPFYLYRELGLALRGTGRFEEAVSAYRKALQLEPDDILGHAHLAVTYSMMGREKEARAEAAKVLRENPKFSWANFSTYKDQSQNDKVRDAWRKAGLN
jgi:TolB-like protein/Tfp pilus assembly protein PilF